MDLSVIIISFNTKDLTLNCLRSLNEELPSNDYEVIVVDNASTDGSLEMILKDFPEVRLIRNQKNVGFAAANNQAAAIANGAYLLFLNSDTIVEKGAVQTLLTQAKSENRELATCALLNKDGSLQPQGGALPTVGNIILWMLFIDDLPFLNKLIKPYQQRDVAFFKKDRPMGWIGGTAMLVKRSLFKKLTGFDKRIFMYAEDVDLCWRAQIEAGVTSYFYHSPKITHLGQGSGTKAASYIGEFEGIIYLFKKHQGAKKAALIKTILKIGALLRWFLFGIILRQDEKRKAYAKIFKMD